MDKAVGASEKAQVMMEISQNAIYLMGASFVLGSMFTLFVLLVLDFVRRNKLEE